MRCYLTLVVFFMSCSAIAQETGRGSVAEFAMSNDTLLLRYITSDEAVNVGRSRFMGDFLVTEERDLVLSGALLFPANLDLGRLSMSVGPRAYAALLRDENNDVLSISAGAALRFELDAQRRLALVGEAFYAPDILTFGTADNLTDLSARVELGFGQRMTGFAGMRWFEFDLIEGGGVRTLQEEVFAGVGYRF
jgi:hypothetical protein